VAVQPQFRDLLGARWEVLKKAIRTWRLFKEIEPGHRFQTRYHSHRRRRQQGETSQYGWIVNLIGGPTLIATGFVFLPTPDGYSAQIRREDIV
jgi:hypothetical protein